MYPQHELIILEARKRALRDRIRSHRATCAEATSRVTHPLSLLDQFMALWHGLAPYALAAAVPLGLLGHQSIAQRLKKLRPLTQWAPIAFSMIRDLCGKS